MEKDVESLKVLNNKIYSNIKDSLKGIIEDLKEILCSIQNERLFKKLEKVIFDINKFFSNYKKNMDIENKALDELKIKILKKAKLKNKEEEIFDNGKYVGEKVDGKRENKKSKRISKTK